MCTTEAAPRFLPSHRRPPHVKEEIGWTTDELTGKDKVQASTSAYGDVTVLNKVKEERWRIRVDFDNLNKIKVEWDNAIVFSKNEEPAAPIARFATLSRIVLREVTKMSVFRPNNWLLWVSSVCRSGKTSGRSEVAPTPVDKYGRAEVSCSCIVLLQLHPRVRSHGRPYYQSN